MSDRSFEIILSPMGYINRDNNIYPYIEDLLYPELINFFLFYFILENILSTFFFPPSLSIWAINHFPIYFFFQKSSPLKTLVTSHMDTKKKKKKKIFLLRNRMFEINAKFLIEVRMLYGTGEINSILNLICFARMPLIALIDIAKLKSS